MRFVRTWCAERPVLLIGEALPATRYLALDYVHDPLATAAVRDYATRAIALGHKQVGKTLIAELDRVQPATTGAQGTTKRAALPGRKVRPRGRRTVGWEWLARAAERRPKWRLVLEKPVTPFYRYLWRATAYHEGREVAVMEGANRDDVASALARRLGWRA